MSASHPQNATTPLPELPKRMMKIDEVAAYLNVPVRWVEDAVQQRRIRHTRIGSTSVLLPRTSRSSSPPASSRSSRAPNVMLLHHFTTVAALASEARDKNDGSRVGHRAGQTWADLAATTVADVARDQLR